MFSCMKTFVIGLCATVDRLQEVGNQQGKASLLLLPWPRYKQSGLWTIIEITKTIQIAKIINDLSIQIACINLTKLYLTVESKRRF